MKDWIKNIKETDIKYLLKQSQKIDKMPEALDKKILNIIRENTKLVEEKQNIFRKIMSFQLFYVPAFAAIILLVVIFTSIFFIQRFRTLSRPQRYASIATFINGKINRISSGTQQVLKTGSRIKKGDIIQTDNNSTCQIQIGNISLIFIDENTEVHFTEIPDILKNLKIKLVKGKIQVNIKKKLKNEIFEINTPFATVCAIGTQFMVEHSSDEYTLIAVNNGIVKVIHKLEEKEPVFLREGEKIIINKKEIIKQDMSSKPLIFEDKQKTKVWTFKKIFRYNYSDDVSKNEILGFAVSQGHVVAQTKTGLICFNTKGKKIWNKTYGISRGIFFMSIPVIINNRVYVSSINKKFLILELNTGKEIKIIDSHGDIMFGYRMVKNNDLIYLPFINGIYTLQLNNYSLSKEPFIFFNSPTTPLFKKNKIYLSSFVDKNIYCYDMKGEELWKFLINDKSFNPIIFVNENIFISDRSGTIYRISLSGELINKTNLPDGITSRLIAFNDSIYTLANDGIFYKINIPSLTISKLFEVDKKPDVLTYLFKSPSLYNNKLFIGTNKGNIIIYDLINEKIEKIIELQSSSISSSVYYSKDTYFVGTKDGEIYLFQHQSR